MDDITMEAIRERLSSIDAESNRIVYGCNRDDLSSHDVKRLEILDNEYNELKQELKMSNKIFNPLSQSRGRMTDPDDAVRNSNNKSRLGVTSRASGDFKSFGDFAQSVFNSGLPGRNIDPRLLRNAPTTISTEGTGADGGYLVPPDYRSEIIDAIVGEDQLLSYCNPIITNSNRIIVPADETTPWSTTSGPLVYWESEAGQKTQSKVALKQKTVRLDKLISLVPVSDELLEDAPSLNSYLSRTVSQKMGFAINLALVQGTGVGEPQGIMNCPSKITVAKESGQAADTVVQSTGPFA